MRPLRIDLILDLVAEYVAVFAALSEENTQALSAGDADALGLVHEQLGHALDPVSARRPGYCETTIAVYSITEPRSAPTATTTAHWTACPRAARARSPIALDARR